MAAILKRLVSRDSKETKDAEAACLACTQPCDHHEQYPDSIAKSIESGALANSVEPHHKHFVISVGVFVFSLRLSFSHGLFFV